MTDNMIQWSPGMTLDFIEKQTILAAFRHFRGNKTATATSLGIAIRTLDNKLEKYQQDDKEAKEKQDDRARQREEFSKAQRGLPSEWRAPSQSNGAQAARGLRVEPASEAPEKPSVSVPVGVKVQEVSPKHVANGRSRKGR